MVRKVTDMDLVLARERGAQSTRPPVEMQFPELIQLIEHYHEMKHENAQRHEANFSKKLAKRDDSVKAIEKATAAKTQAAKPVDLKPFMKMLTSIQAEHIKILKEHTMLKAEYGEGEEHKPCDYKITGKRDQRGLIDLEAGLTFTAVTR